MSVIKNFLHIIISFLEIDDRGNIAIIFALAFIPVVMGAGAAIDFGRAYLVKDRLSHALDAAALAVGSSDPNGDLDAVLNHYFAANYNADEVGIAATPTMTISADGKITLSVTANLKTTFLTFFNQDSLNISAGTEVTRQTRGLEVVLVLDNTGSMLQNNKMFALKEASQELIDILFGNESEPEKLKVGLVPFITTVNIGKGPENNLFIRQPNPLHQYPDEDPEWKGCVEARNAPHDTLDGFLPGDPDGGEWGPYFWEAEFPACSAEFSSFCRFCPNEWWAVSCPFSGFPFNNNSCNFSFPPVPVGQSHATIPTGRREGGGQSFNPPSNGNFINVDTIPPFTTGPNRGCPNPVTPLTNNRGVLEAAIDAMVPFDGNGTMANIGAVWGWRLLSPTPPFTEGVSYDDEEFNKALIILTDGINLVSSGGNNCSQFGKSEYTSRYTGYGYLAENKLNAITFSDARIQLNNKLEEVCENIKETGILIFTIVFELDDFATQELFQNCASSPDRFFKSEDREALASAFKNIGAQLSSLRLSK